jgi:hypothetical protein
VLISANPARFDQDLSVVVIAVKALISHLRDYDLHGAAFASARWLVAGPQQYPEVQRPKDHDWTLGIVGIPIPVKETSEAIMLVGTSAHALA